MLDCSWMEAPLAPRCARPSPHPARLETRQLDQVLCEGMPLRKKTCWTPVDERALAGS